jgi:predicted Holliday junction resolvase-like endonuclease
MANKTEIKETLAMLNNGKFHIECPNCYDEIKLSNSGLFHLDDFTPEALDQYKELLAYQKERRVELKQRKLDIPLKSEKGSKAVGIGFIYERLAPTLDGFTFNKNDCRSMFDPIDYVIFEGLSEKQRVSKIIFMDIKSGNARLSKKQRVIKDVVNDKKVEFKTYTQ